MESINTKGVEVTTGNKDLKRKNKNRWKDKRDKKRQKEFHRVPVGQEFGAENKQENNGDDIVRGNQNNEDYDLHVYKLGSPKFDFYYKAQFPFLNDEEFKKFTATLQEKLPVTFRINQTEVNHEKVVEILQDPHFLEQYLTENKLIGEDGVQKNDGLRNREIDKSELSLECKKFYPPGNVLFEFTVTRELLKKNVGLKAVHKMIQQSNDAGILTRQEIVSMLPPLLLDIQAEHALFDMCAAPGSKTAQAFELMMCSNIYERGNVNTSQTQGFIVANDADSKRAFMLTHQMNRLNTSNIVILNHNAQNFPYLNYKTFDQGQFDSRVLFDRIICDVPCSSDAAIRKIPQKWEKWSPHDGAALHTLQSRILFKGLQLLKVGGKISYSTCSLNPVEDEAVVAAALNHFKGCIQLEKVQLPGFKFREGLTKWRVMADKIGRTEDDPDYFVEFDSFEKVPEEYQKRSVKDTMFTNHYDEQILNELPKCLRVFPHDQNTSGFFITIIKKIKDFEAKDVEGVSEESKQAQVRAEESKNAPVQQNSSKQTLPLVIQTKSKIKTFEFTRCDAKDPDIEYLKAYYGLNEDFPVDQLVTQSDEMKKLFFISPAVSRFLYSDSESHNLNIVNMGVVLFMRNSSKYSTNAECIFRIHQDGVLNIIPYMTKRLIWASDEKAFKYFLMNKNTEINEIEDEKLRADINDLSLGCFVLAIKSEKTGNVEALTMHKFPKACNMMISRENIISLHLRYLTKQEREQAAPKFDLDK